MVDKIAQYWLSTNDALTCPERVLGKGDLECPQEVLHDCTTLISGLTVLQLIDELVHLATLSLQELLNREPNKAFLLYLLGPAEKGKRRNKFITEEDNG